MNGAHIHLIVNHVSLFTLIIGLIALITSIKSKSQDLRLFSSALLLIAGIFSWIAFVTGENAASLIKPLGENTDPFVNAHGLAATWALRSGVMIAILSIGMEWAVLEKKKWVKPLQWILIVFALCGCVVFTMTAFLGGKIRHTEIRN